MTELIRQRADDDCTICAMAMATGMPYERVLEVAQVTRLGYRYKGAKGTYSALQVLGALGVDSRSFLCSEVVPQTAYREMVWRRRAILSVPSLNGFKGWHDVYWDGAHILDPTNQQAHPDDLDAVELIGLVLFDERR